VVDNLRGPARKRVGRRLPEDVTDVGAGGDHQLTAAHPDLKPPPEINLELTFEFYTLPSGFR